MLTLRSSWLRHAFAFFLLAGFLQTSRTALAWAQLSVSGCIEDSSLSAIIGATVLLEHPETGKRAQASSDEKGCFTISNVSAGRNRLRILAEAFSPYEEEVDVHGSVQVPAIILEIQPIRNMIAVTATRTPTPAMTLGSSLDVIGRGEIDASQTRSVADLLRNLAGLTVQRTGAAGGITTLFVRGGESDYNKILIDGIPVNLAGGQYDIAHIPTDNVSRVEVVRGPQSALFGSDAITSVVQIFSRGGTSAPQADYSVEGGTFSTLRQQASLRGSLRKFDFSNTFSRLDTDNVSRNNDYRNASYFGNFGTSPDSRQSIRATLLHTSVRAGVPGPTVPGFVSFDPDAWMKRRERAAGLSYQILAGPRVKQHAAYRIYDIDQSFFGAFGVSLIQHTRHRAEYHGDIAVPSSGTFSYGVDFDRENGTVARKRRSRDNVGYYVQQQLDLLSRLYVTAGIRIEDNDSFGTSANPRLAVSYGLWNPAAGRQFGVGRVRFSIGAGIKEPSFTESFSENRFFLGNPNLKAERSRSWEAGLEQSFAGDRVTAEVAWFDNRFRNLIDLVPQPDQSSRFENIGRSLARGLEVRARFRVRRIAAHANYTYLQGHIQESTRATFPFRVGDPLLRRPNHSADFNITWTDRRWTGSWTTRIVGRRADSDFFTHFPPLTSNALYTTSDAAFSYDFARLGSVFIRINNIFDRTYQEVLGFAALTRSVTVGTRLGVGGAR